MEIKIKLNNCHDCRHMGHSGAFTPGGAFPICGHSDACKVRAKTHGKEPDHWVHRKLPTKSGKDITGRCSTRKYSGKIPEWCPLKKGSNY